MGGKGERVYKSGDYVGVSGEGAELWFGVLRQHVYQHTDLFNIQWLEKVSLYFL